MALCGKPNVVLTVVSVTLVHLTRALSNPETASGLRGIAGVQRKLLADHASSRRGHAMTRPRCGAIAAAILQVLSVAAEALSAPNIRVRVERHLGHDVSQATVSSFLSVACRDEDSPVVRVERALYRIAS